MEKIFIAACVCVCVCVCVPAFRLVCYGLREGRTSFSVAADSNLWEF